MQHPDKINMNDNGDIHRDNVFDDAILSEAHRQLRRKFREPNLDFKE